MTGVSCDVILFNENDNKKYLLSNSNKEQTRHGGSDVIISTVLWSLLRRHVVGMNSIVIKWDFI